RERYPFIPSVQSSSRPSSDPNFRELTRVPIITESRAGNSSVPRIGDQSASQYSPGTDAPFDWIGVPTRDPEVVGIPSYGPTMPTAPFFPGLGPPRLFGRGIPLPIPPMGPGRVPQIPMPTVPEWLKTAWNILRFDPTNWPRLGSGGSDDYRRCV